MKVPLRTIYKKENLRTDYCVEIKYDEMANLLYLVDNYSEISLGEYDTEAEKTAIETANLYYDAEQSEKRVLYKFSSENSGYEASVYVQNQAIYLEDSTGKNEHFGVDTPKVRRAAMIVAQGYLEDSEGE